MLLFWVMTMRNTTAPQAHGGAGIGEMGCSCLGKAPSPLRAGRGSLGRMCSTAVSSGDPKMMYTTDAASATAGGHVELASSSFLRILRRYPTQAAL